MKRLIYLRRRGGEGKEDINEVKTENKTIVNKINATKINTFFF